MKYCLLSILSLITYLSNAAFKSYSSNCGYVYDVDKGGIYPLDVCITDYDPDHLVYAYESRIYICTESDDGSVEIEAYSFGDSMNCSQPTAGSGRSVLGSTNMVYSCGNNKVEGESLDECYVEYKKYTSCPATESEPSGAYTSEYVIVGTCTDTTAGSYYHYARCDDTGVSFVRFNDAECCDLSYAYTGTDGPVWDTYPLESGCNDGYYIDPESFVCEMPTDAMSEDVYTDNTSTECKNNAVMMRIGYAVLIGIIASLR